MTSEQQDRSGRLRVIAEIGSNHDGDISKARRLMDASVDAGATAVKFQLFRAADLYPRNVGIVDTPQGPSDFYDVLQRAELPESWLAELVAHARDLGTEFIVSPFSEPAVGALLDVGVSALKIASPELTHLPLIRAAAGSGRPLILSTGMATLGDVERAVGEASRAGSDDITVLHCTTAYPTPLRDVNARVVGTFRRAFGVASGLSDHTLEPAIAPVAAVVEGGTTIEKHITLSRLDAGPDHPFALEPDEFAAMCEAVHEVAVLDHRERFAGACDRFGRDALEVALGSPTKRVAESEALLAHCDRRSLRAARDIDAGETLAAEMVEILRGEANLRPGLDPSVLETVLGATMSRDVAYGEGIRWEDLLHRP